FLIAEIDQRRTIWPVPGGYQCCIGRQCCSCSRRISGGVKVRVPGTSKSDGYKGGGIEDAGHRWSYRVDWVFPACPGYGGSYERFTPVRVFPPFIRDTTFLLVLWSIHGLLQWEEAVCEAGLLRYDLFDVEGSSCSAIDVVGLWSVGRSRRLCVSVR